MNLKKGIPVINPEGIFYRGGVPGKDERGADGLSEGSGGRIVRRFSIGQAFRRYFPAISGVF